MRPLFFCWLFLALVAHSRTGVANTADKSAVHPEADSVGVEGAPAREFEQDEPSQNVSKLVAFADATRDRNRDMAFSYDLYDTSERALSFRYLSRDVELSGDDLAQLIDTDEILQPDDMFMILFYARWNAFSQRVIPVYRAVAEMFDVELVLQEVEGEGDLNASLKDDDDEEVEEEREDSTFSEVGALTKRKPATVVTGTAEQVLPAAKEVDERRNDIQADEGRLAPLPASGPAERKQLSRAPLPFFSIDAARFNEFNARFGVYGFPRIYLCNVSDVPLSFRPTTDAAAAKRPTLTWKPFNTNLEHARFTHAASGMNTIRPKALASFIKRESGRRFEPLRSSSQVRIRLPPLGRPTPEADVYVAASAAVLGMLLAYTVYTAVRVSRFVSDHHKRD